MLQHMTGLPANITDALLDMQTLLLIKLRPFHSCTFTTCFIEKEKENIQKRLGTNAQACVVDSIHIVSNRKGDVFKMQ